MECKFYIINHHSCIFMLIITYHCLTCTDSYLFKPSSRGFIIAIRNYLNLQPFMLFDELTEYFFHLFPYHIYNILCSYTCQRDYIPFIYSCRRAIRETEFPELSKDICKLRRGVLNIFCQCMCLFSEKWAPIFCLFYNLICKIRKCGTTLPFNFILLQRNSPSKEDWRVDEIEKVILNENSFYNMKNMVRIIPDYPMFSKAAFEYYKYFNKYDNIHFSWHTNFPDFTDYIVTKTGNVGPLFREKAHTLTKYIEDAPPQFTNIFRKFREFSLPDGSTATIYKRDIVPLASVTAQDVIDMIREEMEKILSQFVKEHEGLEIQIIPYVDDETLRGRFKEITISAGQAMIGDYKHKDAGMMVNDIKFTFHDITVNLYELKEGKVEVISMKEVIPSGKIYAKDLREFAAKEAKGIKNIDIHFNENIIDISSDLNRYANLRVKLRPIVTPENNIGIKVEGLNMLSLPIPSFVLNILLNNVYVFKQDITPCRVVLNSIKIENEYLR